MLTQIDFDDYRDVNGVKFPFEYNFYWLDGRFTAKIKDIKINQHDSSRTLRQAPEGELRRFKAQSLKSESKLTVG